MLGKTDPPAALSLELEIYATFAVLHARGELTAASTDAFEAAYRKGLSDDRKSIVFDFEQLAFVSSAGLGTMMVAHRIAQERGGEVVFARMRPEIRRVFELFDYESIFRTFDSVIEATDALLGK